jgi:hypothetical protein
MYDIKVETTSVCDGRLVRISETICLKTGQKGTEGGATETPAFPGDDLLNVIDNSRIYRHHLH